MKQRIAAVVALLAFSFTGSAWSAERAVRLLAFADTLERLASEDHEAAELARFLAQVDMALIDLSGMAVTLKASNRANESDPRASTLLVQYHPSLDRARLLLRVTSAVPTATSRTMMDLEYRRVSDSPDFQLVGWRPLR